MMCIHGPSKGPDDHDEAACAFYENSANLAPVGPGRKRMRPEVDDTDMTSAEFREAMRRGQPVHIGTSREAYEARRTLPSFFGISRIERSDLSSRVDELVFVPDDDVADEYARRYVSSLWAEDWDCPEDQAYGQD